MNRTTIGKPLPPLTLRGELWKWIKSKLIITVTDEMVYRAFTRFNEAINETKDCSRCAGRGYHHGYGEDGHDPDWCESCGGPGIQPKYDEITAMRLALEAALTSAQGKSDE